MRPQPPRPTLFPYTTLFRSLALLNAGTCEYLEAGRFNVDLVERVFAPNFLGAVYCIDAALPLLRRARAKSGRPPRRPYRHRGRGARRPPLRHRYRLHRLQRLDLPPLPAPAAPPPPGLGELELPAGRPRRGAAHLGDLSRMLHRVSQKSSDARLGGDKRDLGWSLAVF